MAQMLLKSDSPSKVARAARRHLRLAQRTGHAEAGALAARIEALLGAQKAATAAAEAAHEAVEDAFDDWTKADGALDRVVKRAHRRAADHDAENAGQKTVALLFAGQAPSDVTEARRQDEPDLVAKLVARGAGLPAGHPAAPLLPELTAAAEASRAAERAWIDAYQASEKAKGAVDVARLAVVAQYRDNFIDIGRAAGADVAEACFPTLRRGVAGADDDATDPTAPK